MSLSSTVVKERKKEAFRLKSFLAFGTIGSLAIHATLLLSGFGDFSFKAKARKEEPIEVTLLEIPTEEPTKLAEEKKANINLKNTEIAKSASIPIKLPEEKTNILPDRPERFGTKQLQKTIRITQSSHKVRHFHSAATHSKAVDRPAIATSAGGGGGGGGTSILTRRDGSTSDGLVSGTGNGSGIGSGEGTGVGSGSGSGKGNGYGSGQGSGEGTGKGNSNGSKVVKKSSGGSDGPAACQKCQLKYPKQAERRGIGGRVEVSVDADADGKVTKVTLKRSSGNKELDEATLTQAREWRLKPSSNGRQGVTISSKYAIKGSHSTRAKKRKKATNNAVNTSSSQTVSSNTPSVRRKRRNIEVKDALTAPSTQSTSTSGENKTEQ